MENLETFGTAQYIYIFRKNYFFLLNNNDFLKLKFVAKHNFEVRFKNL